jgi:tetraacyldisaccharide 4'-kinase
MFLRRLFLFPFAVLYDGITRLRNRLFDLGLKPSASFDIPIISVGNLSVGGTGKTPMVEYLIRLLSNDYSLATLSRGYGRETKGMLVANSHVTAATLGDEPFQIYQKFKDKVVVSVCEERVVAIPFLVDQFPDLNLVLLDDAFQHRFVKPGFSILLTDYSKPFYNDFVLPAGNLRESKMGAQRADVVVVTKCPDHLSEDEMMGISHSIRKYTNHPIFFSKIRYGTPVSFIGNSMPENQKVILVTGIATAAPLVNYVAKTFELIKHLHFNDHHAYSEAELTSIKLLAKESNAVILTTEKDKAKMEVLAIKLQVHNIFSLPIEMEFLKSGADFDAMLTDYTKHASISVND